MWPADRSRRRSRGRGDADHARDPAGGGGAAFRDRVSDSPSTSVSNGRSDAGRFCAGNRFGKGNPHARRVARLRSTLSKNVTPDDLRAALAEAVHKATEEMQGKSIVDQRKTINDLRRSCITNWARKLRIDVVRQLAGHADINTTKKYYLSVQEEDIRKAKRVQKALLGKLTPVATDPKLTEKGGKRDFPQRKLFKTPPTVPSL